jgi:hypothetical protein
MRIDKGEAGDSTRRGFTRIYADRILLQKPAENLHVLIRVYPQLILDGRNHRITQRSEFFDFHFEDVAGLQ